MYLNFSVCFLFPHFIKAQKRLFLVFSSANLCVYVSLDSLHVKKDIQVHDISGRHKSYKLKLLKKIVVKYNIKASFGRRACI